MTRFYILFFVWFTVACNSGDEKNIHHQRPVSVYKDSIAGDMMYTKMFGDFNGDGKNDTALVDYDGCKISFPFAGMPVKTISRCAFRAISEGDLDGNGSDEFSLFLEPGNGCTYVLETYTYKNKKFQPFMESFLVPTACDFFSDSLVQAYVFAEKGKVYHLEIEDLNADSWNLVKKESKILE